MNLPDKEDIKCMIFNAFEKLDIAKLIYNHGYYKDSSSRLYYAVFHIMTALLFTKGFTFSSHHQVIGAINREFIKKELLPIGFKKKIEELFNSRQIGDYEIKTTISKEDVNILLQYAEEIIQKSLEYLSELYNVPLDFWKK